MTFPFVSCLCSLTNPVRVKYFLVKIDVAHVIIFSPLLILRDLCRDCTLIFIACIHFTVNVGSLH